MNGAFSAELALSPALLTDGQQMAFCVQRRRGKGEKKGKEETQRKGGVCDFFFFFALFSQGPNMQVSNALSHGLSDLWPPLS